MALNFPKVSFPNDPPGQTYTISYGGNSFAFDAGLLTQRVGDWVNGVVYDRWRRYDYEHQHQMTDQEAAILGIEAEVVITTPGVVAMAANDAYMADCVTKNLGTALIAVQLPSLMAAQAALTAAQSQLAADTAANAPADVLATDQGNVQNAAAAVTAVQQVIAAIEQQFA